MIVDDLEELQETSELHTSSPGTEIASSSSDSTTPSTESTLDTPSTSAASSSYVTPNTSADGYAHQAELLIYSIFRAPVYQN